MRLYHAQRNEPGGRAQTVLQLKVDLLRIARCAVDEGVDNAVIYQRLRDRIRASGSRSRIPLGPIVDHARQLPLFDDPGESS
jgi:hypothetical protein